MAIKLSVSEGELRDAYRYSMRRRTSNIPARNPFETAIYDLSPEPLIADVKSQLESGRYAPQAAYVAEYPKGGGGIRPVHLLSLRDEIVYTVLGARCLKPIAATLGSAHRYIDYSHRIFTPVRPRDWFVYHKYPWLEFVETTSSLADKSAVIVETDISAFYENVDHDTIAHDLKRIHVDSNVISALRHCLDKWMDPAHRGLPQGYPTSDLLSKFYLSPVDEGLRNEAVSHCRFADDIRIFSRSDREAKKALQLLIRLLRDRTLNIQTAKTEFMDGERAAKKFRGFVPTIEKLAMDFDARQKRELRAAIYGSEYSSVRDIIENARDTSDIPAEVLWSAYDEHVRGKLNTKAGFSKSTFHWLLGKLGKAKDPYAVDDSLLRFFDQPQETGNILYYLSRVTLNERHEEALFDFLEHDDNIYDYQAFEFLAFFSNQREVTNLERLRSVARRYAGFSSVSSRYLRAQARYLIMIHGTDVDLEALRRSYPEAGSDLEKAELLLAITRMESSRRNAFYKGAADDGPFCALAVPLAKSAALLAPGISSLETATDQKPA